MTYYHATLALYFLGIPLAATLSSFFTMKYKTTYVLMALLWPVTAVVVTAMGVTHVGADILSDMAEDREIAAADRRRIAGVIDLKKDPVNNLSAYYQNGSQVKLWKIVSPDRAERQAHLFGVVQDGRVDIFNLSGSRLGYHKMDTQSGGMWMDERGLIIEDFTRNPTSKGAES